MSSCSGPDCNHSSHGGNPPMEIQTMDQCPPEPEDGPQMEVVCEKCGDKALIPEGAPNPVHAGCGGAMYQNDGRPRPEKEKTVQAPPWANFRVNERIPIKGFWFKVVGYTKEWKVVLECVGDTGKSRKAGR